MFVRHTGRGIVLVRAMKRSKAEDSSWFLENLYQNVLNLESYLLLSFLSRTDWSISSLRFNNLKIFSKYICAMGHLDAMELENLTKIGKNVHTLFRAWILDSFVWLSVRCSQLINCFFSSPVDCSPEIDSKNSILMLLFRSGPSSIISYDNYGLSFISFPVDDVGELSLE